MLSQNYPNPFNPSTRVEYNLPVSQHTTITVYNVLGRKVATLVDDVRSAGTHQAVWDGRDQSGQVAASGVYFYRITAGDFIQTRKMTLLK